MEYAEYEDFVQPPIMEQDDDVELSEVLAPDGRGCQCIKEKVTATDAGGHKFVQTTCTRDLYNRHS